MDDLAKTVQNAITIWTWSYFAFAAVFYIMCVAAIAIPALIAADVFDDPKKTKTKLLAALSAVLASVISWSQLNVVAANFDNARADLKLALIAYQQKIPIQADPGKTPPSRQEVLYSAFKEAEVRVRSFSPGQPQTGSTSATNGAKPATQP